MNKCSRPNEASCGLNDRRGRSASVAVLLVLVVLLSASSGVYAGASFFAQQVPNVTTTVYSTTTRWTTLIVSSTVTQVVQGVLTTATYTTSTSTMTVTASTSSSTTAPPALIRTGVTITQVTKAFGSFTVKGILKDVYGTGLQGLQLRVTVDGRYQGRLITGSDGSFTYAGPGPTIKGAHTVTVWFDGTTQYASSAAAKSYYL